MRNFSGFMKPKKLYTMKIYKTRNTCRSCNSPNISEIFHFGETPLSDRLLKDHSLNGDEIKVPLTLAICRNCSLVQIKEEVNPVILFQNDYPYYSSVSQRLMAHFKESALQIMDKRNLTNSSLVVEAASNDGYMLQHFLERGIPVLGIDPAEGPAKVAVKKGIPTIIDFFGTAIAEKIVTDHGQADIFLGNNVLAHVPDTNDFVRGIRTLLKDDGMAVIEAPYLLDLLKNCEFDTIYHQHYCYFSVTALQALFKRHGLYLNHVKHVDIHGGTLRMFVEPYPKPSATIEAYLEHEASLDMISPGFFNTFTQKIQNLRENLLNLLQQLKADGRTIVGYGAAGKANTFLSYFGIDSNYLDYIVDASPYKHGLYFSGNHLPILPTDRLTEEKPDYVLILAWNFADEIMQQQEAYHSKGGKFIIPIPETRVL